VQAASSLGHVGSHTPALRPCQPAAASAQACTNLQDEPLEIVPISRHHWVGRYRGDPTPVAEAPTQTDARAEAYNLARQFGERTIHVHTLDDHHTEHVDPDHRASTPRDVKGQHLEP
jgi:hypothetical protein